MEEESAPMFTLSMSEKPWQNFSLKLLSIFYLFRFSMHVFNREINCVNAYKFLRFLAV